MDSYGQSSLSHRTVGQWDMGGSCRTVDSEYSDLQIHRYIGSDKAWSYWYTFWVSGITSYSPVLASFLPELKNSQTKISKNQGFFSHKHTRSLLEVIICEWHWTQAGKLGPIPDFLPSFLSNCNFITQCKRLDSPPPLNSQCLDEWTRDRSQ